MTLETAFRLEITTPLLSHMTEEERKATHIRWERLQRIIELAQLGQTASAPEVRTPRRGR